jgi:hypothetical protein
MIDKGELSVMVMAQRAADRGELLVEKNVEIKRLRAKLWKVAAWLEGQVTQNEQAAQTCRFESLRDAYVADAKNYRAIIKDIKTVLPTDTGSVT